MIVLLCHSPGDLHPRVMRAIEREGRAPTVVCCETPGAYPEMLLTAFSWMREGHDVAVVEQDVEIRFGALAHFETCPRPWCFHAYPFSVPFDQTGLGDWFSPLGCTRLRAELGPVLLETLDTEEFRESWVGRDVYISEALAEVGYRSHRHEGDMIHHHDYAQRPSPVPPRDMDARVRQRIRLEREGLAEQ